jgi:hypothetical protein
MRYTMSGEVVEAVQFKVADPRTHWHVNVGDVVSEAVGGPYVRAKAGVTPIRDGDWVVKDANGLFVLSDEAFRSQTLALPGGSS